MNPTKLQDVTLIPDAGGIIAGPTKNTGMLMNLRFWTDACEKWEWQYCMRLAYRCRPTSGNEVEWNRKNGSNEEEPAILGSQNIPGCNQATTHQTVNKGNACIWCCIHIEMKFSLTRPISGEMVRNGARRMKTRLTIHHVRTHAMHWW